MPNPEYTKRSTDGSFMGKIKAAREVVMAFVALIGILGMVLAVWGDDRYAKKDTTEQAIAEAKLDSALIKKDIQTISVNVADLKVKMDSIYNLILSTQRDPR